MNCHKSIFIFIRVPLWVLLITSLYACVGESSNPENNDEPPVNTPSIVPLNLISHASFRDQDGTSGKLSGTVRLETSDTNGADSPAIESVWVYWANAQQEKMGAAWLKTDSSNPFHLEIPQGTLIPDNSQALLLYPSNATGLALQGSYIPFHDFVGNSQLSGPGGNELHSWVYGEDRPNIAVQRNDQQGGLCIFDNGLVSVIDMANTKDDVWENNSTQQGANTADDMAYPPYEFTCEQNPVNTHRKIKDEIGIWTYSTINDAMFYGTVVYDTFVKYLGEPPLEEKIRLRVHYDSQYKSKVFWDGAYANFSDGYPFQYSMASLDSIAHEVGHGVLNRISDLNLFEHNISTDARTLHEAFGDIAGVMAKYEFSGHTDNWIHGEESVGSTRQLNQIKTEAGAIASHLDYDDAGDNFYQRIGMISYPFYLLSNKWGIEPTYKVYLMAAKTCWSAMTTLTQAAQCIKQQAVAAGLPEADVIHAFKTVKIKLFDDGVLSHFYAQKFKLRTEFSDDSRSTNQVIQWLWDFGDGQTSTQASPSHTYEHPGDYEVTLEVTDQSSAPSTGQDSFTRVVSVSDEYCAIINSINADNTMTGVEIAGANINFDQATSDYTQNPINLTTPENVVISIQGDNIVTERSTTWKIWIDLNNDGVFGDTNDELVADIYVAQGQPYKLDTILDLSALGESGETKYMRIIGKYALITPCSSGFGEVLDVTVTW